jgi:hypothetical protein
MEEPMAQTGKTPRRQPPDPWSAIGLSRRAALGFLGAGAGFGIAAADKLWREGLPTSTHQPPDEVEPLVSVDEVKPRTLEWALAVQYSPEARFGREAYGFLRVALQHRGERRLLTGCRRVLELVLTLSVPDPDALLVTSLDVVAGLGATGWLGAIQRRIELQPDRFSRSRDVVRRMLMGSPR